MSFILSKLFWVFLSPGNFLALLLLTGAFLASAHKAGCRKAGHAITFIVALLFFFIGIFPVGGWMLVPLENRFPPQLPKHVAGIILLGGDEKPHGGGVELRPIYLNSGRRYIEFASLARRYPEARLLYSGGSSKVVPDPDTKYGDVAKQALGDLGVPVEKMMFENASRNTRENAVLSYQLAQPDKNDTWLLVTSAFHMPRALATFRKAGWSVQPATTGYLTDGAYSHELHFNLGEHLMEMAWATHEYYGLLDYWLMGYTDQLWPG